MRYKLHNYNTPTGVYKSQIIINKLFRLSYFLMILLCTLAFLSCNDSGPIDNIEDPIGAELPKGRSVIIAPISYDPVIKTVKALGGPTGDDPVKAENPDSRREDLQKKYKELLMFHADDSMMVNAPRLATLILARNESKANLKIEVLEVSGSGNDSVYTRTDMEFGSKMRARLIPFGNSIPGESFTIEPLGDDEQTFRETRNKIIWQWKITPLKAGKHELKLSVQIIEKDGEAVTLPAKSIPVVIYAKEESVWKNIGSFIERKWEFLLTAIMLPILIAYFTTRMRNKPAKQEKEDEKKA